MDNRFDFDKIGKRMPYTVPDGFFDELERSVRSGIAAKPAAAPRRKALMRHIMTAAAASVAAVIALPLLLNGHHEPGPAYTMESVEQAFANLNSEDQAYMLEIYSEDIFINQ